MLKLKELFGLRAAEDGDNDTKIVVTVEGFLHCFESAEETDQPVVTMKIDSCL